MFSNGRIPALSDADFMSLICRETGAGLLLDIENLYVNAHNHGVDARAFLDALPARYRAGSPPRRWRNGARMSSIAAVTFFADTHSHPVPSGALDLLDYALLRRHIPGDDRSSSATISSTPSTRLLDDLSGAIRARLASHHQE